VGNGAVMAMDPETGQAKWTLRQHDVSDAGMLTTASDLLFTGGREGHFMAVDARTGALLWRASLGGQIVMGPITFMVEGYGDVPPYRETVDYVSRVRRLYGSAVGSVSNAQQDDVAGEQTLARIFRRVDSSGVVCYETE
jgi:outer membrane protein assembly factor BamB